MSIKLLHWIGSSLEDLKDFPEQIKDKVGYALHEAQMGDKNHLTKPLKGFSGASVLEIVSNYDGDTYRAVYTVRFKDIIYVLHTFQKKSKTGISTPKKDMDLIASRLLIAQKHNQEFEYDKENQDN